MANKQVNALTSSTPTIDDLTVSFDNADTSELKQTTWQAVRTLFKAYFDTTYQAIWSALTVWTTTISGGTSWRILYDNAWVVWELATTWSGNNVLSTSPTLTTPIIASIKGSLQTDTDGATITFDKNVATDHSVVLWGNRTLVLSNMVAWDKITLRIAQDATGSRIPTLFNTIKWVGWVAIVFTTTPNKADSLGFFCTSTGNYDGYILWQNI